MSKPSLVFSTYDDINNPYYGGGGAYAVHEVAKRLTDDYAVTVISGNYPKAKNEEIDRVAYKHIGLPFGGGKVGQISYVLTLPFVVKRTFFSVWIESFTPPFSSGLLPLFTQKPVIGLVHMLSGSDMKRKYKLPFDIPEKIGIKLYSQLIAPSEIIAKKLSLINPKATISIIHNGIAAPKINKAIKKKHILFLGRIEVNQKGIDLLIKAYAQAKIPFPLVIAGGGEEKQEKILSKILEQYPEAPIQRVGKIEGDRKEILLNEAVAVVVPSRFETFSLTSLEALAYGVPLITFAIDGLSWIPNNARIAVKPYSITELSNALTAVTSTPSLRNNLSEEGKRFAKHYSWDTSIKKYKSLIQSLL